MSSDTPDPKTQRPADQGSRKSQGPQQTSGQSWPGAAPGPAPPQGAAQIGLDPQIVILQQAPPTPVDTAARLSAKARLTVAFPPCSDELLALIKSTDADDISRFFNEYFKFLRHQILGQYYSPPQEIPANLKELADDLGGVLDPSLLACLDDGIIFTAQSGQAQQVQTHREWPTDCCICNPCVTLDGNRNRLTTTSFTDPRIRRLFVGDLLWLFYFDRMGIFQILGAILDAYASSGRLPISNGSIDVTLVKDDVVALVLEVMVRQTKTGLSSTVRDRAGAYRTCLGWVSDGGRKLNLDTEVNNVFSGHFHKFIYHALEFYKDRRLAVAIQGAAAPVQTPSVATLITIRDTLDVLKKRFEPFAYGRNYYNTLSGIIWTIAGMAVIRELRTTLGIAPALGDAHEFIPAAYDLLVLKRSVSYGEANRFDQHRLCAENGRDLLLDIEVVNFTDILPRGELENWLVQVEGKVEAYRTAYRTLTGVDLGANANPTVNQAV
jgi:hypothetical protein